MSTSRRAFNSRYGYVSIHDTITQSDLTRILWSAWQAGARWQKRQNRRKPLGGEAKLLRELHEFGLRAKALIDEEA